MGRWIACDRSTAETIAASLPGVTPGIHEGEAFEAALAAAPAAAVLPGPGDEVLYVEVRPAASASAEAPPVARSYEAGGFLGLSDEAVYGDED